VMYLLVGAHFQHQAIIPSTHGLARERSEP
jgi:hypothetical protein